MNSRSQSYLRAAIPWIPAAGLYLLILTLLAAAPAQVWPPTGAFGALPYFVFAVAIVLGVVFAQTRVAHLAVLMTTVTALLNYFFYVQIDLGRAAATVLLAALLIPPLAATLFRLNERGFFTTHGAIRGGITLGVIVILLLVSAIPPFTDSIAGAVGGMRGSLSRLFPVPAIGLLALVLSAPFLILPKEHESPRLGGLLLASVWLFFCGLGFRSSLWNGGKDHAALVLFMSGAALTLVGAILESAWWHANMDELTELPGRRFLKHHLRCLGPEYSIAVIDLDFFKRVNDTYGHDVGDQVLRFLAFQLRRSRAGTAYRFGGEEFVMVAEGPDFDGFVGRLDELRASIQTKEFVLRASDRPLKKPRRGAGKGGSRAGANSIVLTVSIGAARSGRKYASPQEVLEAADRALYRAKEGGRNQVCRAR